MNIIADYHTHTTFSHGTGSIEDNVLVALEKGLKTLAISDHGPGHAFYGIKRSSFPDMRKEIDRLNKKYSDIEILLSLEANFMSVDGTLDLDPEMIEMADMIMCGYHFGSSPKKLFLDLKMHAYALLSKHFKFFYHRSKKINTKMMLNAMNKYPIDAITHPGAKAPVDVYEVAKLAAKKNIALEVNVKHGHLNIEEIKEALKTDVMFFVGSDAHSPDRVGDVEDSLKRCIDAGVSLDRIINVEA